MTAIVLESRNCAALVTAYRLAAAIKTGSRVLPRPSASSTASTSSARGGRGFKPLLEWVYRSQGSIVGWERSAAHRSLVYSLVSAPPKIEAAT